METVIIQDKENQSVKLSPAPILPAASFTISNNTGINIRVTVDGRKIVLEQIES